MSRYLPAVVVSLALILPGCTKQSPPQEKATSPKETRVTSPSDSGYADLNGIRLYYEIYGSGEPLVLLHGGLMMIQEMMPLIQPLAAKRRVILPELQGHGRTADTDRPLRMETLADDVAALIEHLGIDSADVAGYSLGGDVALRVAIQHQERVRRLVLISTPFARSGWYPEVQVGMTQVTAGMAESMKETPTGIAVRSWPEPERFPVFLDKLGAMMSVDYDWSADVPRLSMPVMLVYADHDAISTRHIAEFFALLGGGLKDPGWADTRLTNARLLILPGYSHYNFHTAAGLGSEIAAFLDDPLTKPRGGAAAVASEVEP